MPHSDFDSLLSQYRTRCNERIEQLIPNPAETRSPLAESMAYACLNGGKRLRAALCYATADALQQGRELVDDLACAIEFIHAYSLVHDDLPAMDDDHLRRGKPTNHVVYGEALAILSGDALQALAFETIAKSTSINQANQVAQIMTKLAQACGTSGMVEGQCLDLESEGKQISLEQLEHIHALKTGALISASIECSAIICGCEGLGQFDGLSLYGKKLGLAFQIHDDILDVTGETATLGKARGSDTKQEKSTYPQLLGLEQAQAKAQQLHAEALEALSPFGHEAQALRTIAGFTISRNH